MVCRVSYEGSCQDPHRSLKRNRKINSPKSPYRVLSCNHSLLMGRLTPCQMTWYFEHNMIIQAKMERLRGFQIPYKRFSQRHFLLWHGEERGLFAGNLWGPLTNEQFYSCLFWQCLDFSSWMGVMVTLTGLVVLCIQGDKWWSLWPFILMLIVTCSLAVGGRVTLHRGKRLFPLVFKKIKGICEELNSGLVRTFNFLYRTSWRRVWQITRLEVMLFLLV